MHFLQFEQPSSVPALTLFAKLHEHMGNLTSTVILGLAVMPTQLIGPACSKPLSCRAAFASYHHAIPIP